MNFWTSLREMKECGQTGTSLSSPFGFYKITKYAIWPECVCEVVCMCVHVSNIKIAQHEAFMPTAVIILAFFFSSHSNFVGHPSVKLDLFLVFSQLCRIAPVYFNCMNTIIAGWCSFFRTGRKYLKSRERTEHTHRRRQISFRNLLKDQVISIKLHGNTASNAKY